jgi:hypothetical protein
LAERRARAASLHSTSQWITWLSFALSILSAAILVTNVGQVMQSAAANAEEAAAAGAEPNSQAAALRSVVVSLQELVGAE